MSVHMNCAANDYKKFFIQNFRYLDADYNTFPLKIAL